MAQRHRPQPVEHAAVDALQMVDNRREVVNAVRDGARQPAAGQSAATLAIEAAFAFRPNRLGPTSSCSSSAVRRRSSSCAVIRRRLSARFSARAIIERAGERVELVGDRGEFQYFGAAPAAVRNRDAQEP